MKHKDAALVYLRAAYRGNRLNRALTLFFDMVDSVLNTFLAVFLQLVIDAAGGSGRFTVLQLLYLAIGFGVLAVLAMLGKRRFYCRFLRRANLQYRQRIFSDLTDKNIAVFSSKQTGTYISMVTADAAKIDTDYFQTLTHITRYAMYGISGLALMLWYSWKLALVAIGLCILPIGVTAVFGGRIEKLEKCVSDENGGFVSMVKDLLSGFSVIKSFQAEKQAQSLFGRKNEDLGQAKYGSRRTNMLVQLFSEMSAFTMQIGVFLIGAYFAGRGWMTPGGIVAFLQLTGFVVNPLQSLPGLLAQKRAARSLIEKAAETLQNHEGEQKGEPVNALGNGIVCKNLCFGYTPDREVLKGIDLHFAAGKSYAIVGASGSGKSTLLNLLLGSYDTYGGSITVGGKEIKNVRADSLYGLVSIIQQNVFVFDATIEENITMFKHFPEHAVQNAIRQAGLEELVREKGRGYRCGENGSNLSGGERQRISIARCLLKNTQVLLMDEATAALDAQTAFNVTGAILDVEGLTRIIVTHKLDAAILSRFDEILVLRGGKVSEQGTFCELLEEKGYFYALYNVAGGEDSV